MAEVSGNHGGDLRKALDLVEAAADCGADALKLQTYTPDTITVRGLDERFKIKSGLWKDRLLHDLYKDAMTPWEWHIEIAELAKKRGMVCFSSPFDETAVDFLEKSIQPELYKVASFEMNHYPMLERIGRTSKPVFASVGVSNHVEISKAIETLVAAGCPKVVLLHCVSEYPAKPEDFCLKFMPELGERHKVPFGLSDHSLGFLVAVAATALCARVIEKHFCLDREESTVDGAFSMLPHEFSEMAQAVRTTHRSISGNSLPGESSFFKRSILVSSSIAKGDLLTVSNLRIARPGDGLCPSMWKQVLGRVSKYDLPIGHPLSETDFF